jgi:hypothetical protein
MTAVKKTKPTQTVAQFLSKLPADRRRELSRVRTALKKHLPKGFEEVVEGSVIAYQVPVDRAPDTYNGRPLWYAALGSPKSYLTLHLMPVYWNPKMLKRLDDGFKAAGKKLDIGKACIHYQRADDLALEAIGQVVASTALDQWIALAAGGRKA